MARIKTQGGATADAHIGRPDAGHRLVNPGTECGSTVLFPSYESFRAKTRPWYYGRMGTPTHAALQESLANLEGAAAVALTPSGLSAISLALLSVVKAGGHVICTDSAYEPIRAFCDGHLAKMGVETTYVDPRIGAKISDHLRETTQAILCESPGSLTFEIQDLPAIIDAAGEIPVIVDNTWGAGVYLRPLEMGAAMSVQSLTKYVGGHSDLLMGAVMAAPDWEGPLRRTERVMGVSVSGRDVAIAHRGLRTLHRRLDVHQQSGLEIAQWLARRPEIQSVIHPGLTSHADHALWQRDFSGACGLFSVIAAWKDEATTAKFIDALPLFGLGYSWGGFESLCLPAWPETSRTAVPWSSPGQLLRFHIGLEDTGDLTAALETAFDSIRS